MTLRMKILVLVFIIVSNSVYSQKYYLFDTSGKLVMPEGISFFDKVEFPLGESGYINVCKNEKWGVLDTLGNVQVPIDYQRVIFHIADKSSAVMMNNKWGFINSKRELVIPYKYIEVGRSYINSDRYAAKEESGLWGVVDLSIWRDVFPFRYEDINNFEGDYAVILKGNKYGVVYKDGKEIIPAIYTNYTKLNYQHHTRTTILSVEELEYGGFLLDSLGNVLLSDVNYIEDFIGKKMLTYAGKNGKKAIINTTGEYLSPFIYDKVEKGGDGLIGIIGDDQESHWFNGSGKLILKNQGGILELTNGVFVYKKEQKDQYDYAGNKLSEKIYPPKAKGIYKDYDEKTSRYGFIDENDLLVISYQYKDVESFDNNRAIVSKSSYIWGVIDSLNREIIPFEYTSIQSYSELERFYLWKRDNKGDDKKSVVDWNGKPVSPHVYDNMNATSYHTYMVLRDGKWGIINSDGQEIVPCIYDRISHDLPDRASIWIDNKVGLLDITINKVITPCKYDKMILSSTDKYIEILYKGKWGISDLNGNEIIAPLYDYVHLLDDKYIIAQKGENKGLLDMLGNIVIPFKNTNIKQWGNLFIVTTDSTY